MRRAAWFIVLVIVVVLGIRACQTINALERRVATTRGSVLR